MSALILFQGAWSRYDSLTSIHAYLSGATTGVINKDEILRAEWVARVSALDLYVHELIVERLVAGFASGAPLTQAGGKFTVPLGVAVSLIGLQPFQASSAFENELRRQLGRVTYQFPDAIADGIRMFSNVELWNSISIHRGYTGSQIAKEAKKIKGQLSIIVDRRNKIAHEGDMMPTTPRSPWAITAVDVLLVRNFIEQLVTDIDTVV